MFAGIPNYLSKSNSPFDNLQLLADRRVEKTETMVRLEQELSLGESKIVRYKTASIALAILGLGTLLLSVPVGLVVMGMTVISLCKWRSYAAQYLPQTDALKNEKLRVEDIKNSIGEYLDGLRQAKQKEIVQKKLYKYTYTDPITNRKLTNTETLARPDLFRSLVFRGTEDYDKDASQEFKEAKKYAQMLFDKGIKMTPALNQDAYRFLHGQEEGWGKYITLVGHNAAENTISYTSWKRPIPPAVEQRALDAVYAT